MYLITLDTITISLILSIKQLQIKEYICTITLIYITTAYQRHGEKITTN